MASWWKPSAESVPYLDSVPYSFRVHYSTRSAAILPCEQWTITRKSRKTTRNHQIILVGSQKPVRSPFGDAETLFGDGDGEGDEDFDVFLWIRRLKDDALANWAVSFSAPDEWRPPFRVVQSFSESCQSLLWLVNRPQHDIKNKFRSCQYVTITLGYW